MTKEKRDNSLIYLKDEPIKLKESPIVDTITEELKNNKGKIIGLLGSWGSGKSSIIESIKESSFCEVIEYDAWKNEGYPFKLGFLKYLASYAQSIECNKDEIKCINNQIDILQQIKDEKKAINYSIINLPNALIATSFLFYPLAFKMLENKELNTLFTIPNKEFYHINIFISVGLFLFGIVALTLNYLLITEFKKNYINVIKTISKGEVVLNIFYLTIISAIAGFCFKEVTVLFIFCVPLIVWLIFNMKGFIRKIFGKTDEFYLLAGTKPHTESIITINKTPEPNYNDFKDVYSKILSIIKEKQKNKKVIIVIDNIDRIEKEEAHNIWSCLKGMILKEKTVNLIIPIDEKQVSEIYWENTQKENEDSKTASFIQKTFDITFRVSPFIMTKAKDFWKRKLNEAFNNQLTDIEEDEIISIFDTRNDKIDNQNTSNYSGNLTPRKIIKLINDVVSLQKIKIFKNISIVTKFAYALHYKNISNQLQKHKLSNLFPETNSILNDIAKNKQGDIAALYYTVSPEEAIAYVKEEDLCKSISSDTYIISDEDARSSWIWDILFDGLAKRSNEPYSILLNTLSNLIELDVINPSKNDYLFDKIINKIGSLKTIDKIRKNDSKVLCHTKIEKYRDKIKEILKLVINQNNKDASINPENWIKSITAITRKYNITKQEFYDLTSAKIPTAIYKKAIPLISKEDCELFDSHIFEPENLDEVLKDINIGSLYKHLNFIIECPPIQKHIDSWNEKMENVVFPQLQKNINNPQMLVLLGKAMQKKKSEPMIQFMQTNNFFQGINIATNISECAVGLATCIAFAPNLNISNFRQQGGWPLNVWNKLVSTEESYISEFVKTYLSFSNNNILTLLNLPDYLPNKSNLINYAVDNMNDFKVNSLEYFAHFDTNIKNFPRLKDLLNKIKLENNFSKTINALNFSDENKMLLYVLAQEIDQSEIKENAFTYFDTISKESWLTYLKNCDLNIKNAIILGYEGVDFVEILKNDLMILFKSNQNNFVNNYKNELPYLNHIDKKLKFVNDFLDNGLVLDNYDLLIENFNDSVITWLKKTSHKNDVETIFTNFIRKINNADWLIKNKNIIKKYITTDDNKNNFRIKWQGNNEIINNYESIISIQKSQSGT